MEDTTGGRGKCSVHATAGLLAGLAHLMHCRKYSVKETTQSIQGAANFRSSWSGVHGASIYAVQKNTVSLIYLAQEPPRCRKTGALL